MLAPGFLADVVVFKTDPLKCPVDDLFDLKPVLTMVAGKSVHDPEGITQS